MFYVTNSLIDLDQCWNLATVTLPLPPSVGTLSSQDSNAKEDVDYKTNFYF